MALLTAATMIGPVGGSLGDRFDEGTNVIGCVLGHSIAREATNAILYCCDQVDHASDS